MSDCNCYIEYEYENESHRAKVIGEIRVYCDDCLEEEHDKQKEMEN